MNRILHKTGNQMRMKHLNRAIAMSLGGHKGRPLSLARWLAWPLFVLSILLSFSNLNAIHAQSIADSFGGFSNKNNKDPIKIEADTLEVLDDKKIAIFSGNVKVVQGKFQLVSKKLEVTYSSGAGGKKGKSGIKRIDATGKVAITTPDNQSATASWAKFDVLAKIVTIGGNVVLSQSGNVMRGDTLVIDLNTGRSKFRTTAPVTSGKKGKRPRISGVFFPGKAKAQAKAKKAAGKNQTKKPETQKKTQSTNKPPLPWQKKNSSGNQ
ncbi:MAG: hypothetical protein GY927_23010 [bacterium]|nr:hypothetical protein [bacterium]